MRTSLTRVLLALTAAVVALPVATLPASAATGRAVQLDAGEEHTCAVTPAGRVKCWGDNGYGELGIGDDLTDKSTPVLVPGLDNVKKVYTGTHTTCAIVGRGGKLMCWGRNEYGTLGDGTTDDRHTPVVTIKSGVKAMDFGEYHACALLDTGRAKCWGDNGYGEVGTGEPSAAVYSPVLVKNLTNIKQVSVGYDYSCALTETGAVKCWGYNGYGALGDGTLDSRPRPKTVVGLDRGVKTVQAGYANACAIVGDGKLKCWGDNGFGSVGAGTTRLVHTRPTVVEGMSGGVKSVDVGYFFACALKGDTAKCWGSNNNGQVGNGDTSSPNAPVTVKTLRSGAASVQAGSFHACALLTDSTAKCWGANWSGQLGSGVFGSDPVVTPQPVLL